MADQFLQGPLLIEDLKIEISVLVRNNRSLRKGFLMYAYGEKFIVNGGDENGDSFIDKVKDVILENIEKEHLSIKEIAGMVNMSRTTFYNECIRLTGEAPKCILYRIRMERGRELLESGLYRINDIPDKIGMRNVSYF